MGQDLTPVHPESMAGDDRSLRWVFAPGTLDLVGVPAALPDVLQRLLDDGTLTAVTVEPAAVRTTLGDGLAWREHGARVRGAVQSALADADQGRAAPGGQTGDDVLRAAVSEVIDGSVGAYIRSHGGRVEVLSVQDRVVEVRLSGTCSHCPASDVTLTDRLEAGIRSRYPGLRGLTARNEPGPSAGRRLLRLLPTRGA
jgi:Fe/S biogenesis protein NfuA